MTHRSVSVDRFSGPFRLDAYLDRGGMGEVWKGTHGPSGVPVAVKFIVGELDEMQHRLLRDEVRAQARLEHPGTVRILDFGKLERDLSDSLRAGTPYMVMPLLTGGSLKNYLGIMNWAGIRGVLLQLLDTLAFAHARGLIHRDIKPANVLRASSDPDARWILADYGLAYAVDRKDADTPDDIVAPVAGTPEYMAPEQLHGDWREFGPWTDLYQIGAMAWQLVTRMLPFDRSSPMATALAHVSEPLPELQPAIDVPAGVESWIRRLMKKDRNERFTHAAEAAWALMQTRSEFASQSRAPFPNTWERDSDAQTDPGLVGAGLSLFDLREAPIVGRRSERSLLWTELRRARDERHARTVVIAGPSGVGKSRLARWVGRRADEAGVAIPFRALHGENSSAQHGLADLFETYLRTWGLDREQTAKRIHSQLQASGHGTAELTTDDSRALAEFIRAGVGGSDDTPIWSFGSNEEIFALATRVLSTLTGDDTVVIGFDDLQWGSFTANWLAWLSANRADVAALFVATWRTDTTPDRDDLDEVVASAADRWIELDGLSDEEQRQVVESLLPLTDSLADSLARQTTGNPMYARQLLSNWIERGMLVSTPNGFEWKSEQSLDIPDGLHAVWLERVRRLISNVSGDDEKLMVALQAAATLGRDVNRNEWESMCHHLDVSAPRELTEALVASGLAKYRHGGWRFVHSILVETLVAAGAEHQKTIELNGAAVSAVKSVRGDARSEMSRLATYQVRARQLEDAVDSLRHAWDGAVESKMFEEAAQLLTRQAQVLEQTGANPDDLAMLWHRFAHAQMAFAFMGAPARAVEIIHEILPSVERSDSPFLHVSVLRQLGLYQSISGDDEAALMGMATAEKILRSQLSDGNVSAEWTILKGKVLDTFGWVCRAAGDDQGAMEKYGETIRTRFPPGRDAARMSAEMGMAWVHLERGDIEATRAAGEAILRQAKRLGRLGVVADAYNIIGEVAKYQGDWDKAVDASQRTIEVATRRASYFTARISKLNLAVALFGRGDTTDAFELFDVSMDDLEAAGLGPYVPYFVAGRLGCRALLEPDVSVDTDLDRLRRCLPDRGDTGELAWWLDVVTMSLHGVRPDVSRQLDAIRAG